MPRLKMVSKRLNILLADDDKDDCLFFQEALDEMSVSTHLNIVHDGDQLMQFLYNPAIEPADVLFLDLNMPRKNGFACLKEIKIDSRLSRLPVIIFSTSFESAMIDKVYTYGAQYYICKPSDFSELKKVIEIALDLVVNSSGSQPTREIFLLSNLNSILQ